MTAHCCGHRALPAKTGEGGYFDIGLHGRYFYGEEFIVAGSTNQAAYGSLSFGFGSLIGQRQDLFCLRLGLSYCLVRRRVRYVDSLGGSGNHLRRLRLRSCNNLLGRGFGRSSI